MKYDFVEIGTSNFDTLIQTATNDTKGLSIEPIQYYLNCLPNKPGVQKINCAVSSKNRNETLEIYYVPEHVIRQRKLPDWLKGCNSVGDYHIQHHRLGVTDLVIKDTVECVPIGQIFDQYQITELDYLKIDTEGSDCNILVSLFRYLRSHSKTMYPKKILFESNELTRPTRIESVKKQSVSLGYRVVESGHNTVLEFSVHKDAKKQYPKNLF